MLKWESKEIKYISFYEVSKLGELKNGVTFIIVCDGTRSRKENNSYKLTCKLPGINPELGHFETPEKAKEYAEEIFKLWLNKAGLIYKLKDK